MLKGKEQQFSFQVEGVGFSSTHKALPANEIIEMAKEKGIPTGEYPIPALVLKGQKNTYSGKDPVDLSKDNNFSLGPKIYRFKVNGQELESPFEKLVALDIIETTEKKGVPLPGKAEDLRLETIGENPHQFALDEWVNLGTFNDFLLIVNNPTPVA